jgi:hypothetical protein
MGRANFFFFLVQEVETKRWLSAKFESTSMGRN